MVSNPAPVRLFHVLIELWVKLLCSSLITPYYYAVYSYTLRRMCQHTITRKHYRHAEFDVYVQDKLSVSLNFTGKLCKTLILSLLLRFYVHNVWLIHSITLWRSFQRIGLFSVSNVIFHTNWREIELECILYQFISLLNKLQKTTLCRICI